MDIKVVWERGGRGTCFKNMWFLKTKHHGTNIALVEKVGGFRYRICSIKGHYRYFENLPDARKAIEKRYHSHN